MEVGIANIFIKNKLNLITGWREYPYDYTEKKEKAKKASKQRTIERRKLKSKENEKNIEFTNWN